MKLPIIKSVEHMSELAAKRYDIADIDLGMVEVERTKPKNEEPSDSEVKEYMETNNENYYSSREALREKSYGGKPPSGYASWGDYWKAF
jgi:hypothetical protein